MIWLQRDPLGQLASPDKYAYVMGEPRDGSDSYGLYLETDKLSFPKGTYYHVYERGWFGGKNELVASFFVPQSEGSHTGRTPYDDIFDEFMIRNQEMQNSINVGASRAVDAIQITQTAVGIAVAVIVPGPEDAILLGAIAAREIAVLSKIGDKIVAFNKAGKVVELTADEIKAAEAAALRNRLEAEFLTATEKAENAAKAAGKGVPGSGCTDFKGKLDTNANEAHFYSGSNADGVKAGEAAEQSAKESGGTTLEMVLANRGIELPKWDPTNPDVVRIWREASKEYAESAKATW